MRFRFSILSYVALLSTFFAGPAVADPWMGLLVVRDAQVWPGGHSGNYGTAKYFIDESRGETIPIEVFVQVYPDGHPLENIEVELYTNLNRRDFAKVFEPVSAAGTPASYWLTYPMTRVSQSGANYIYKASLAVSKTGVYRLTARFRIDGGPWFWHNQFRYDGAEQRDCAVVVSPKKVLDLSFYEANTQVVEASPGGTPGQRSTLEDFTDHDTDGFDPFNLKFIHDTLGFNTLWLMPIFPVTGERYDIGARQWGPNFSPGSPYAARNYWAVNERFAEASTQAAAMNEFVYLVERAENLGLNVFIDVAFNHSGHDTVVGQGGIDLGLVPGAQANALVRMVRPAWATSRAGYRQHASGPDELALFAPSDRLGEHAWYDAGLDWFFGDYSSLGPKPYMGDVTQGGALDERDLFYTDLDPAGGHDFEVENVWNYFAYILPYWLNRTGNRLDGIRADFSQGLPPQAWEYIINKTRQKKWDFVFLAEVLDPDQVRYRVNRHFDIVTTVDHWLYRNNDVSMSQLAASLENEAGLYGYNAAVMHNGTSHDEEGNGNVWLMVARYAVVAASYGAPMVYMGQPLGIPYKVNFESAWENLKPYWDTANAGVFSLYRRINSARQGSQALRSTNRHFLRRQFGQGFNDNIFSAARWANDEVVLVFVNLRDYISGPEVFAIPDRVPLDGSPGVKYQAYNLLADDPNVPLWSEARTAADIYRNGVYVEFHFPDESQYLQLRKAP